MLACNVWSGILVMPRPHGSCLRSIPCSLDAQRRIPVTWRNFGNCSAWRSVSTSAPHSAPWVLVLSAPMAFWSPLLAWPSPIAISFSELQARSAIHVPSGKPELLPRGHTRLAMPLVGGLPFPAIGGSAYAPLWLVGSRLHLPGLDASCWRRRQCQLPLCFVDPDVSPWQRLSHASSVVQLP